MQSLCGFLIQDRRTNNEPKWRRRRKKKKRILVLYSSIYLTINATDVFADVFAIILYTLNQFVLTIWLHTTESSLHGFVWIFFSCCCCWFSLIPPLLILLCYWSPRDPMWWSCCDLTIHIFRQHFSFPKPFWSSNTHSDLEIRVSMTCQMTWINRWTKLFEFTAIASLLHRLVLLWNSCWYMVHGYISTRNWLLHINLKWVSISNWISSFVSVFYLFFFTAFQMGWYPYQHAMTLYLILNPTENREVDWVSEKGKKMIDVTYVADNRSISPLWVSFRLFITQFTCTGFEKDASYRFVSQIIIEMKWRKKK